ncbi:MAG: T9SS type A sorting domain-containing protein, partial [Bacteroidia bacterium]|nr:T9SS type A sorting domain-containing protein [Bacteroidia bacterium]
ETKMTIRVWSPDSGIVIRLKVEDKSDATKSCETDAKTTIASAWETLEFDFTNEATGTAKLDLTQTFDKASLFFNKGVTGDEAGEKTYYFDDLMFGGKSASTFITAALGLKYFPNPVNDVLNIASDFTMDQVTVFNQLGQIVLTHSANVSNTSLDMTSLPTGIYMVRVEANNKAETFKITK